MLQLEEEESTALVINVQLQRKKAVAKEAMEKMGALFQNQRDEYLRNLVEMQQDIIRRRNVEDYQLAGQAEATISSLLKYYYDFEGKEIGSCLDENLH